MTAFLVFGRTRYDEPLRQIGNLDEAADAAPDIARATFGDGLIELSLIAENDVTWVFRSEDAGD